MEGTGKGNGKGKGKGKEKGKAKKAKGGAAGKEAAGVTVAVAQHAILAADGGRSDGEAEWLAADTSRSIVHSREYDEPEEFRGESVLVVGGRGAAAARAADGLGIP